MIGPAQVLVPPTGPISARTLEADTAGVWLSLSVAAPGDRLPSVTASVSAVSESQRRPPVTI